MSSLSINPVTATRSVFYNNMPSVRIVPNPTHYKDAIITTLAEMSRDVNIIDSLPEEDFDRILEEDKSSSYSQVALDETSNLKGFILAVPNQDRNYNKDLSLKITNIEKLAVLPSARQQGIAKRLLHSVAQKAVAPEAIDQKVDQIRVLVYKNNQIAMDMYFRYGFDYVSFKDDQPYNAFLLCVSPQELLRRTGL